MRKIIVLFFLIFSFLFLAKSDAIAQACTGLVKCSAFDFNTGDCALDQSWQNTIACDGPNCTAGGQCNGNGMCEISNNCAPQGGATPPPGGSSCPAECRQGSSCGTGYSASSSCGGCNSNQVCCKANFCGGGGGGASYSFCPAGSTYTPSMDPAITCEIRDYCTGYVPPSGFPICGTRASDGAGKEWCSQTSDVCVYPPPPSPSNPTNLTAVCSANSTSVTLSWTAALNATSYLLRVDNTTNNSPSCAGNGGWNCSDPPDKYLDNYTGTSYAMTVIPNQAYVWWIHGNNSSGFSSGLFGPSFNCSNCSLTAPTITSIERNSPTSATIKWTPGTAQTGSVQKLFVSQDSNQVTAGCTLPSSPGCVVNQTNLASNLSTYTTGNVLAAGSVYYFEVVNYSQPTCQKGSTLTNSGSFFSKPIGYLSSCSLSPSSLQLQIGQSGVVTSSVDSSSEINRVEFSSSNSSVITTTSPDSVNPYTSTVTSVGSGNATITSTVYFDSGDIACTNVVGGNGTLSGGGDDGYTGDGGWGTITPGSSTDTNGGDGINSGTTSVTSNNLSDSWWQVLDSDITSNGILESDVPTGEYFGIPGLGGFVGIPTYTTTTNLTVSNVSENEQWITQNTNTSNPVFDYAYFENQIPSDVVFNTISSSTITTSTLASGGTASYGYYWYLYDGTTSGVDLHIAAGPTLGNRKVVLLVKSADVFFDGPVNLNDGLGFFMTICDHSIHIDPSVGGGSGPNLEGFFIADENIDTGAGTNALHIRGAVVGYEGILMNRDLGAGNSSTPSELFEYAPDQSILFPAKLANKKISWKEVAP